MHQSCQTAATMFTAIAWYKALVGNDGQKAFAILNKNRAIQELIIEEVNGRWIKKR